MAKAVVITGSRSDWGLLEPLVDALEDKTLVSVISLGDFPISGFYHKLECLPNSDTSLGTCTAQALVLLKLPQLLCALNPKVVIVLGDRFEIFAAAQVAYTLGIPIAHIEGSDTTLGSLDEGYRKCIRELATLHFDVEKYGSLGCVFPEYNDDKNFYAQQIMIYHPWKGDWKNEFCNLLSVMEKETGTVAFVPNADAGGRYIKECLENSSIAWTNGLPRAQFIDLLKDAKYIIGNSSSGIIEAPSLKTPTINIEGRQSGRMRARSVVTCVDTSVEGIRQCIENVENFSFDWDNIKNPYEKSDTVSRMVNDITNYINREVS